MLKYQAERYDEMVAEFEPLLKLHYEEVESDKDVCPLVIHHEMYQQSEDAGILQITTARHDGELVGYCFFLLVAPLHHATTPHAMLDLLFLLPKYRKGRNAVELFKSAEARAIAAGARKIVCGCKADHSIASLFKRLGYRADEIYYSKVR